MKADQLLLAPQAESGALANLQRAAFLIGEAKTIDEALILKAIIREAEIKARKQGLGEVSDRAIEYRYMIIEKLNEILSKMPKNPGTRRQLKGRNSSGGIISEPPENNTPTLKQLGISKSQAKYYRDYATLSPEKKVAAIENAKKKARSRFETVVKEATDEAIVEAYRENPTPVKIPSSLKVNIRLGDFRYADVASNSVQAILTDPLYGKKFVAIWEDLGRVAKRVLEPGGFLIAYSGQLNLPVALSTLSKYLDYVWCAGVSHNGTCPTVDTCKGKVIVTNCWKPVVIFSKGVPERTLGLVDMLKDGELNDDPDFYRKMGAKDFKIHHDMAQKESEARYLLGKFTRPGDLVFEPMAGGGTTIAAAVELKRNCLAYEIDKETHAFLLRRFKKLHEETQRDKFIR